MITDIKINNEYRDSVHKYSEEQLETASIPLEIPWEPDAVAVVEAHPTTRFVFFVPNTRTMALVAERLSQSLKFDITTLETGRMSLAGQGDKKWREFTKSLGPVATRGLLLRLVTRAIERGNHVGGFAAIVSDILTEGVQPADADILGRARNLRNKN